MKGGIVRNGRRKGGIVRGGRWKGGKVKGESDICTYDTVNVGNSF